MKNLFASLVAVLPLMGIAQERPTVPLPAPPWLQQQSNILDGIAQEVLKGIPQNWTTATLTIESDGRRIDYSLKNKMSLDGRAIISADLARLCEALYLNSAKNSTAWKKAVLSYDKTGDGGWKFSSQMTYP